MDRLFQGELMAIVPVYVQAKGNCTIVYMKGSEPFVVDRRIKNVLNIISKHYMIDLSEVKKRYRNIVSSPNLVPIPLSRRDVFVPFKTRVPMYKNDGAFSYINMNYICDITNDDDYTFVHLIDGSSIKCLSTLPTVDNHMRNGHIVSRCYEDRVMRVSEPGEFYNARITLSSDDISILRKELEFTYKK